MDQEQKTELWNALRRRLARKCDDAEQAQRETQAGMVHEESRAENDKDTRATESSYLARGQAARVVSLRAERVAVDAHRPRRFGEDEPIAVGAFVLLEDPQGNRSAYLLAPAGAGEQLQDADRVVAVITPSSPLGRRLQGAVVDDEIELETPRGHHQWTVVEIA